MYDIRVYDEGGLLTINDGTEACMISSSISIRDVNLQMTGMSTRCLDSRREHTHSSGFMTGQTPLKTALAHSALSFIRSSSLILPSPSTSEPAFRPRMRSECHILSSRSFLARFRRRNRRTYAKIDGVIVAITNE